MTGPDERVLIEFLGWTRIDGYWYTPELLDESPKPGLQSGEPVEVPEPCKFLELVKAEMVRRLWTAQVTLNVGSVIVDMRAGGCEARQSGQTEAEAFSKTILLVLFR